MDVNKGASRKYGVGRIWGFTEYHNINKSKKTLNCRQLWNEQELHILSGSKRKFTLPRGRVMQRLLELDGF